MVQSFLKSVFLIHISPFVFGICMRVKMRISPQNIFADYKTIYQLSKQLTNIGVFLDKEILQ